MRRFYSYCAASASLAFGLFALAQAGHAGQLYFLKGRYAFTLAERCVHQLGGAPAPMDPGGFGKDAFGSPKITDPMGAQTYSGASDGMIIFDGNGNVSLEEGRATNIMNAASYLMTGAVPAGFGLGTALPFTCNGKYNVTGGTGGSHHGGKIRVDPFVCKASLPQPNAFGALGFDSVFTMDGWLPQDTDHLVLTDIGLAPQPVIIHFPAGGGNPAFDLNQQRICTRALSLVYISPN